jgi:hypothetical protein
MQSYNLVVGLDMNDSVSLPDQETVWAWFAGKQEVRPFKPNKGSKSGIVENLPLEPDFPQSSFRKAVLRPRRISVVLPPTAAGDRRTPGRIGRLEATDERRSDPHG